MSHAPPTERFGQPHGDPPGHAPDDGLIADSTVIADRPCSGCGYNLLGLPASGHCPECATPVERSLQSFLLRYSSPEYLASVTTGLKVIFFGILADVLLKVLALATIASFIAFAFSSGTGPGNAPISSKLVNTIAEGLALIPAFVILYGYFSFSTQDPRYTGTERQDTARLLLRTAVVAHAIALAVGFVMELSGVSKSINSTTAGAMTPLQWALFALRVGAAIVAFVAWLVQFFSMMRYCRWMAERIPDEPLAATAKRNLWLLPLLTTIGALLFGLGPLIALILYLIMLHRLRAAILETAA
jgi:hypothetical protein